MNNFKLKTNILSKILIFILCGLIFISSSVLVFAEVDTSAEFAVDSDYWTYWPQAESITGKTACLMDADTGTILYSKGLDAQRFPASITKLMTALIVAENCSLDDQVTMTETGMADAYAGSSNCNPQLGEVFTVRECLELLLIKSANDIASQLAEHTAGSVQNFATMMNERALLLGCTNTNFVNASGLEDSNHYTSARDMALIMRAAIQNDTIREIMGMPSCTIPATNMSAERYYTTHNLLMQPDSGYYYEGCLGGKTGYTDISQSTLVCYAQRNDMTLIGVVMGAPETQSNASDMITLFDYGFNNFYRSEAIPGASCLSGGTVTLPYGLEASQLTLTASDNGENKDFTLTVDDHIIGRGSMTSSEYSRITGESTDQTSTVQDPSSAASQSTVSSSGSVSDTSANNGSSTVSDNNAKNPVLYVIMIILGIAILGGILYIIQKNKKQKRRRRKKGR